MYDSDFGVLVPDKVSNDLDINCIIIKKDRCITFSSQNVWSNQNGTTVLLYKLGKHYKSIAHKACNEYWQTGQAHVECC